MRVMVIITHPNDQSFNHALLAATLRGLEAGGHTTDVLDLYKEDFDPVMTLEELAGYSEGKILDPKVSEYQARIDQAEHLLFIFPVWWEVMPALLKGWLDKVFLPGWAFEGEGDTLAPLLKHITGATAITTMEAPAITFNSVENALLKGVMGFCGVPRTSYINFLFVSHTRPEQRAAWLDEVETYARTLT
jgi:NAD(P)H dehydrogenase (quinone)